MCINVNCFSCHYFEPFHTHTHTQYYTLSIIYSIIKIQHFNKRGRIVTSSPPFFFLFLIRTRKVGVDIFNTTLIDSGDHNENHTDAVKKKEKESVYITFLFDSFE
jgi:hypothetical protein